MYWDYRTDSGLLKIHFEPFGILGFVYVSGIPVDDLNILNINLKNAWIQKFKKHNINLIPGFQIDRDVSTIIGELCGNEIYSFDEINLKLQSRKFWTKTGWVDFKNSTPFIEYRPCNSVLLH